MKLTVLADNNTIIDQYFLAEPALSFYIEDSGKKILFDAGYSDVFVKNAAKLGIDLKDLDFLVISHGHLDHTWGLEHLINLYKKSKYKRPKLVAHPAALIPKFFGKQEVGMVFPQKTLAKYFDIILTDEPFKLTKNITFLGAVPRMNDFEICNICGDTLPDDSSLVFKGKSGLTIITACAHAGIVNICEYVKKVCHASKISNIIGGLHLLEPKPKQILETVKYLKRQKLQKLYPCHCVDLNSKIKLSATAPLAEIGSGTKIEFK